MTLSVPEPDLVTTPVYLVTVELLPAPVEPTQMMQLPAEAPEYRWSESEYLP